LPDLDALGIDRAVVEKMYAEWQAGAAKSALERRYLDKGESHGKLFTALVKQELGVDTERASHPREEIHRLREEIKELRAENERLRRRWSDTGGEEA
jgi:hypothetical protein